MKVIDRKKKAMTKRMLIRRAQTVQEREKTAIIRFQNTRPLRKPGAYLSLAHEQFHLALMYAN